MDQKKFDYFIGPKAENIEYLKDLINKVLDFQGDWRKSFYKNDESLYPKNFSKDNLLEDELNKFLDRSGKQFPYFHPRYSAQMLKDPAMPTILGYLTFMLSNPNNHAYEGGPVTTEMEMEVTDLMLKFVGFNSGWGHLSSGGSLANTEALWAARDYYKTGKVYFSEVSHYSWKRICSILRIDDYNEIPVDKNFRMDLNKLEEEIKENKAMFVMANLGSTGTGSVDDLKQILELKKKYDFHLHIDAAYGGFVRSVILNQNYETIPFSNEMFISEFVYEQLKVLSESDSITIDPHKHGLISYGAGAVLFKNDALRDVVLNTAPYTYHKTDKPNIGMFSLEGSRPGAMAAACYLTYKIFPPHVNGLGEIIKDAVSASHKFYDMLEKIDRYQHLSKPDLDINCFYKIPKEKNISELNKLTIQLYNKYSVEAESPEFILSKFVIPPHIAKIVLPEYKNPLNENLIAMRIVFMKHWSVQNNFYYVNELIKLLSKE